MEMYFVFVNFFNVGNLFVDIMLIKFWFCFQQVERVNYVVSCECFIVRLFNVFVDIESYVYQVVSYFVVFCQMENRCIIFYFIEYNQRFIDKVGGCMQVSC